MTSDNPPTGTLQYQLEVEIHASSDRVWKALTEETNAWWLSDFHMVGEGSVVSLDARAGGLLVESKPDGGSLLWYTVQMVMPGKSLHLVGHLAPEWGGPATTMLELVLEQQGDVTRLIVRDALFGRVNQDSAKSLEEGWTTLFSDGLRKYVERA